MPEAQPAFIATSVLDPVDAWLNHQAPPVEAAVDALRMVRTLEREAGLAEAHIIAYVRGCLKLDDLTEDPGMLDPDLGEADL